MTHDTAHAIAHSQNVQNALGLLMTAIRHEARQKGVDGHDIVNAIDYPPLDDPLDAVIEALIVARFTQVLEVRQCSMQ